MQVEKALGRALRGSGESIDFTGTWVNGLESEASITQTGNVLSGIYMSKVSATGGETIGDLSGYSDGDLISFVVHWRDFQAITAWVGQLDPTAATLNTLWQMTKQVAPDFEWNSINAGADYFHKKA